MAHSHTLSFIQLVVIESISTSSTFMILRNDSEITASPVCPNNTGGSSTVTIITHIKSFESGNMVGEQLQRYDGEDPLQTVDDLRDLHCDRALPRQITV